MQVETKPLPENYDYLAPDKSEIRLLSTIKDRGSLCHCTLPPGYVSNAVTHKTVDEIWYFLQGQGEAWRKQGDQDECVTVKPGLCLNIPLGIHFQFRNSGLRQPVLHDCHHATLA